MTPPISTEDARQKAVSALLAARNSQGHWTGELSHSALATATAVCALAVVARNSPEPRAEIPALIQAGLDWLAANQNPDGGWGDTDRSLSNISTTILGWAAFGLQHESPPTSGMMSPPCPTSGMMSPPCARAAFGFGQDGDAGNVVPTTAAENWLRKKTGTLDPADLVKAITRRYGNDRTFSIPILTLCAITGRLGPVETAWKNVTQLPFELAALPASWFGAIRLPVVSYALPALIAIGQVRHHFRPTRNPVMRWLRSAVAEFTLQKLSRIQPANGGFLEATPLTAFVTISLAAMNRTDHPVVQRGVDFLIRSAKPDGSWAIDTNLSTWVTTLAVQALGGVAGDLPANEAPASRDWLLGQQYRAPHPYTNAAPGGWAWTDQPGGVPDADDTAGALLTLRRLGPIDPATRLAANQGIQWLLDLQNNDGGIPTFCKGWGTLPFDRSSPDITAHALLDELPHPLQKRTRDSISKAVSFLKKNQRPDGAWIPLWFGHQESPNDENPLYGTARILLSLQSLTGTTNAAQAKPLAEAAVRWLIVHQNSDGGWSGAHGAISSIEETALALEALAGEPQTEAALQKGNAWLTARINSERWLEAAPIGFYFARLWYYERLYPLIFATAALKSR